MLYSQNRELKYIWKLIINKVSLKLLIFTTQKIKQIWAELLEIKIKLSKNFSKETSKKNYKNGIKESN